MNKSISVAIAGLAVCVAGTSQATIFGGTGPNAVAVLFDANDYNAGTGVMPNLGTIGSSADTFPGTTDWPTQVSGNPSKTASHFGAGLDSVTFTTAGAASGEALSFNPAGLPSGTAAQMTYFVVADDFNTGPGLGGGPWRHSFFGYGEGITDNDSDGAVYWSRPDIGGALAISPDASGGPQVSIAPPNDQIVVVAVSIDVATLTASFSMRDSGGLTTMSDTSGGLGGPAWSPDTTHGYLNGNGDGGTRTYMADWKLGAAAIIPANLSDTDRNNIVESLYGRYALGSGEALIPEPSSILLLGLGMLGLTQVKRRRSC